MTIIKTKYSIGDTVFHGYTLQERREHPCPDCNGERKWTAKSPAGSEYTFGCPRCSMSYISDRDLQLDYTTHVPSARQLTIGSIQHNTAAGAYDHCTRYMCPETGVGSGSVYNEGSLFETEDEALNAARVQADLANTTTDWIVKLYDKSLKISDYELDSATLKLANDEKSHAKSMLWNLGDLFCRIDEADDKEAILEAVKEYKEWDWPRDKEKILT